MIPIWRGFGFALGEVLSANSHADGAAIAKTGAGAAPACQTVVALTFILWFCVPPLIALTRASGS